MSSLSTADLKLVREIVDLGHNIERTWAQLTDSPSDRQVQLDRLRELIQSANEASSAALKRLAFHERDLSIDMSARHLATVLVPFERLLDRAFRDDEFLVTDTDTVSVAGPRIPLVVIADNIRSAFNVGAIFRTAEAFAAESVWLSGYSSTPEDEKTARTSMGTQTHIDWRTWPKVADAIHEAKQQGFEVVALETAHGAHTLGQFKWPSRAALVLGNERFGLDREVLAMVDHVVKIPLSGTKNSLNVGIASGIALADFAQQAKSKREHQLSPIGVFRATAKHPYEARRQAVNDTSHELGTIELQAGRQFEQALSGLEGFEKIWLLYQFDRNPNWKPKVMPPRGPRVKQGVFATRAPYRPNQLGLSCVDLVSIDGLKITVKGFDLLDETPIFDIKPYIPYADAFPNARAGWTDGLDQNAFAVEFAPASERCLEWLKASGVSQIREFIRSQLEFDPLDSDRKRVVELGPDLHQLSYRTWRVQFSIDAVAAIVRVEAITSGYSSADLGQSEDPQSDKELHRRFSEWCRTI